MEFDSNKKWFAVFKTENIQYLILIILLCLFYFYQYFIYPPALWGEEATSYSTVIRGLDTCINHNGYWQCLKMNFFIYNKGFSWLIFTIRPIVELFSEDIFVLEHTARFLITLFQLSCIFSVIILYKKYDSKNWIYCAIAGFLLATMLISFRRFKWHSVVLLGTIAVYYASYYFDRYKHKIEFLKKPLLICLSVFILAVFNYILTFYLIVPILLISFLFLKFETEFFKFNLRRLMLGLMLLAMVVLITYFIFNNYHVAHRIKDGFKYSAFYSTNSMISNLINTREYFSSFISKFSLILFCVGTLRALYLAFKKKSYFYINHIFLIFYAAILIIIVEGFQNLDYTIFYYIPLAISIMIGASTIISFMEEKLKLVKYLFIAGLCFNAFSEVKNFKQLLPIARYQGVYTDEIKIALILKYIKQENSLNSQNKHCYMLPEVETSNELGGFNYFDLRLNLPYFIKNHNLNLVKLDLDSIEKKIHDLKCENVTLFVSQKNHQIFTTFNCEHIYPLKEIYGELLQVWKCNLK